MSFELKGFFVGFITGMAVTYICLWILSPYVVAWLFGWGNRI